MSFAVGAKMAAGPARTLRWGTAARPALSCTAAQSPRALLPQRIHRPCRWLSLRATAPCLGRASSGSSQKSANTAKPLKTAKNATANSKPRTRKTDPRSDVWPESVNSAAAPQTRHGRLSQVSLPSHAHGGAQTTYYRPSGAPPPQDFDKYLEEYEKDEEPYDEAKERARARREYEDEVRRGYNEHRQAVNQLFAQRQLPFVGAALAAGLLGFCTMPLLFEYMMGRCNDCADDVSGEVDPAAVPSGLPPMGAAAFDVSLDVPEKMMGIGRLRAKLAGAAEGDVLEVAVGTGRNVQYYTWNPYVFEPEHSRIDAIAPDLGDARPLTSFTGVDLSGDALEIARRRLRVNVPAVRREAKAQHREGEFSTKIADGEPGAGAPAEVFAAVDGRVRLFRGDAQNPMPAPTAGLAPASRGAGKPVPENTAPDKYDTVIQTFGLCSVADPVVLLQHMADAVKPDTGRIVLLEHGRAEWSIVNSLLDRYAGRHFLRFGCWWNRDLLGIVEQAKAVVPGLEVVQVTRPGLFQFGTLYWIELRVKRQ